MVDAQILYGYLNELNQKSLTEIQEEKKMSSKNIVPIILHDQVSRISRFEEEYISRSDFLDFNQYCIDRFSEIKKQFRELEEKVKRSFEEIERRFEAIDRRFEDIDRRFTIIDKKFEAIDKRFEAIEKRLDHLQLQIDRNFKVLSWTMGIGFTLIGILQSYIAIKI